MKLTNKADLPGYMVNFLTHSEYNRSGRRFDISCTALIDSPHVRELWKAHGKDAEEDVSTKLWSSVGTAIHKRLEDANSDDPDVITEKRFVSEVGGKMVSAQIDILEVSTRTLVDLKTTSAWQIVNKNFKKYEQQLNIQAYLANQAHWGIRKLQALVICRDWSKARSAEPNYPNTPIQLIDLPMWGDEEQLSFIIERLALHYSDEPKTCSDEERWAKPATWAVKKKGRKSALRVLPSEQKALSWIASGGHTGNDISIEERPATYTRCVSFCAVNEWCSQYQEGK